MINEKLTCFFESAEHDERIHTIHIVLYLVLYEFWARNDFRSPFSISRSKMMKAVKISTATYHKYMKQLHSWGYINYSPSYHPKIGSIIFFE